MSLLYTFNEIDQKAGSSYKILDFRFFLPSGSHKTLIPEDTKLGFLLTTYLLLSTLGLG